MTEVYLYEISDIGDRPIDKLLSLVSPERKTKIQRLKKASKQRQSLFADVMLRAVLCDRLRVDNSVLRFSATDKGKPYLVEYPKTYFNVSHTDGLVAVAVSDSEVGVDAEAIRDIDLRLCQRFFSRSEQDFVMAKEEGRLERFYRVWTRKEAYVKRSGDGLTMSLQSFSTVGPDDGELTTFTVGGYTVSVCGDSELTVISSAESQRLLEEFAHKFCL